MIDREYVKVNTSIHTSSNTGDLKEDENGNIPAKIELRLPGNLLSSEEGPKKIENITMQTSKMRVSMMNTPIASFPVDESLPNVVRTKCQLDVYPFVFTNRGTIEPNIDLPTTVLSFPQYKKHSVKYNIMFYQSVYSSGVLVDQIFAYSNTKGYGFPTDSKLYPVMQYVEKAVNHKMNLCINRNHEYENDDDTSDTMLVNSLASVEASLEDALENAITFASTNSDLIVEVHFISKEYYDSMLDTTLYAPTQSITVPVATAVGIVECYLWRFFAYADPYAAVPSCELENAIKPKIQITDTGFSIAYDTAPFDDNVPILWAPEYVDSYETPPQMTLDVYRNNIWSQKPPKRVYKYGLALTDATQDQSNYEYTIFKNQNCAVMNLIANKATKDTFSFLPWSKQNISSLINHPAYYQIEKKLFKDGTSTLTRYTAYATNMTSDTTGYMELYPHSFNGLKETPESTSGIMYIWLVFKINPNKSVNDMREWYDVEIKYTYDDETASDVVGDTPVQNLPEYSEEYIPFPIDTPAIGEAYETHIDNNYHSEEVIETYSSNSLLYDGYSTDYGTSSMQVDVSPYVYTVIPDGEEMYPQFFLSGVYAFTQRWVLGKPLKLDAAQYASGTLPPYQNRWIPSVNPTRIIEDNSHVQEATPYKIYTYKYRLYNSDFFRIEFGMENVHSLVAKSAYPYTASRTVWETANHLHVAGIRSAYLDDSGANPDKVMQRIPNLDLDENGTFYILDCGTASVNIGEQEPIYESHAMFEVSEMDTVQTQTASLTASEFEIPLSSPIPSDIPSETRADLESRGLLEWHSDARNQKQGYTGYSVSELAEFLYEGCPFLTNYPEGMSDGWMLVRYDTPAAENVQAEMTNILVKYGHPFYHEPGETPGSTIYNLEQSYPHFENIKRPDGDPVQTSWTDSGEPTQTITDYKSNDTSLTVGTSYTTVTSEPTTTSSSSSSSSNFHIYGSYKRSFYWTWHNEGSKQSVGNAGTLVFKDNLDPNTEYAFDGSNSMFKDSMLTWYDLSSIKYVVFPDYRQIRQYASESYFHYQQQFTDGQTEKIRHYILFQIGLCAYYPNPQNENVKELSEFSALFSSSIKTDESALERTVSTKTVTVTDDLINDEMIGNTRLTFAWSGLPTIVMSPISSYILAFDGAQITHEIQPINMKQPNGSSLITSFPIIEKYFVVSQSLRDLHDELVVVKDQYNSNASYNLDKMVAASDRSLTLTAYYLTKDGRLHQIYVPKNGVFEVQLTFCLEMYNDY